MKLNSGLKVCGVFALAILLASCVGMDTKVKISRDGSGTVDAEYRLSEDFVAFGQLEANKSMLPVPLTKQDVENSLAGAKGLKLSSWSSRRDGTDLLVRTVITFDSLDALMYYLDPSGQLARHSSDSGGNRIDFSLGNRIPKLDPDMKTLAQEAFAPYAFKFVVELPSAPKDAQSASPAIAARTQGNSAIFEGKMQDIVASETPPAMSMSW
jgi:hypothetical protein